MKKEEVYEKVVGIISKHAQNRSALNNLNGKTNILNDLEVNSARLVDIILDFEDKFEIAISDDDTDKISTIEDAVALVQRLVSPQKTC